MQVGIVPEIREEGAVGIEPSPIAVIGIAYA